MKAEIIPPRSKVSALALNRSGHEPHRFTNAGNNIDRLLTLAEVMALTSLSRTSVYRHVATGTLPAPLKLSGMPGERGRIAWKESDIGAWLASRARANTRAA